MSTVLPCPFTAGGCPLFNIQPGAAPVESCQGGCSPAPASAPASAKEIRPSARSDGHTATAPGQPLPTPPAIAYDNFDDIASGTSTSTEQLQRQTGSAGSSSGFASGLSDALLFGELSLPVADGASLEALNVGEPWAPLDAASYGISPGQLEYPPYWSTAPTVGAKKPFATGSTTASSTARSSAAEAARAVATLPGQGQHDLWDIEELVSYEGPKAKRTRRASPPPPTSLSPAQAGAEASLVPTSEAYDGGNSAPEQAVQLPTPPSLPSPPRASHEENEHVTPFISKLCYLLEHKEYEPWVRWDSTGQYLLVAHSKPHLLHVLEKFFRHTVISSFIRQLNIYGFRRASTSVLLTVLENTTYATTVQIPGTDEIETFSAADYSAFVNPNFFRSTPGGPQCRYSALKPIAKERPPRTRASSGRKTAPPATRTTPSRRSSASSSSSRKRAVETSSSGSEYGG
ncbi:hypothetical protein JCM10908_006118 [Rhodotorula pacifica]|uniref:heat shock factor family protein n=1 Tax=Rhodotorula pacifica TaxID=1495444 RepID=UPI00316D3815